MTGRWDGTSSKEAAASARVVETEAAWRELWERSIGIPAPSADLGRCFAVAVFLGARNTGGFGIELLDPETETNRTVVRYRVLRPSAGRLQTQIFTQPYAVRLYPKTSSEISVREAS